MNKRSLITFLAALLMCASSALADAAETTNPLDEINSLADSVCSIGRYSIPLIDVDVSTIFGWAGADVNDVLFFCNYASLLRKAEDYGNGLMEGAGNTARRLGVDILERTIRTGAGSVGGEEWHESLDDHIATTTEQVEETMNDEDGAFDLEAYRQTLLTAIDREEQNAIEQFKADIANPDRHPAGSEEHRRALALSKNFGAQLEQEALIRQSFRLAREQVHTSTPYVAAQQGAEAFMQNDAYTQTVASVVRPHNSEEGPGTAAQLEEAASNATSTRESINELSRGWADYMRQDAILTANVIEGLRASVQQQAITNWQLQNLAAQEHERRLEAIQQQQAALEQYAAEVMEEAEAAFQGLFDIISMPATIYEDHYHPDFCAMYGCPGTP